MVEWIYCSEICVPITKDWPSNFGLVDHIEHHDFVPKLLEMHRKKTIRIICTMLVFRYGNIFCATGPFVWGIHRSAVNSPHKSQWRGSLMFSWIYAWRTGWINNHEAGDLRHHRAHYDVIVILFINWIMRCCVAERITVRLLYTYSGLYVVIKRMHCIQLAFDDDQDEEAPLQSF